jgi:hypothetical protein
MSALIQSELLPVRVDGAALVSANGDTLATFSPLVHPEHRAAIARAVNATDDAMTALGIAATTLETVARERDPKNVAAMTAAKRCRTAVRKYEEGCA